MLLLLTLASTRYPPSLQPLVGCRHLYTNKPLRQPLQKHTPLINRAPALVVARLFLITLRNMFLLQFARKQRQQSRPHQHQHPHTHQLQLNPCRLQFRTRRHQLQFPMPQLLPMFLFPPLFLLLRPLLLPLLVLHRTHGLNGRVARTLPPSRQSEISTRSNQLSQSRQPVQQC